jgi:exodeoxyribonuclease VII large subunit
MAVRDHAEIAHRVRLLRERAGRALRSGLDERRRRLENLTEKYGFRRQRDSISLWQQRVDDLADRLRVSLAARLRAVRERLRAAVSRYGLREWPRTLEARRESVLAARERLSETMVRTIHDRRNRTTGYADRLRALSPRLVLERGFCIARRPDGSLVRAAEGLSPGDPLLLEFARGEADARVERTRPRGHDGS